MGTDSAKTRGQFITSDDFIGKIPRAGSPVPGQNTHQVNIGSKLLTGVKEWAGYLPSAANLTRNTQPPEGLENSACPPSLELFKRDSNADSGPSLQELRTRMFAVHATDIFPQEGKLRAGAVSSSGRTDTPSFRPTLHFALGELVREHGFSSWDSRKFAVVAPLGHLESQLTNVMTHDTFVLGDLKLKSGSVVLAPEGEEVGPLPQGVEVRRYQPEVGLRQSVEDTIRQAGGWNVSMQSGTAGLEGDAKIGAQSVNHPQFFQELLQARPGLSFGDHLASQVGDAGRFGTVEQSILSLTRGLDSGTPYSSQDLKLYRAVIAHHLPRLKSSLENYPPESRQAFEEKLQSLQGWLNLVDVDLAARQHWGKTVHCAPKESRQAILEARGDVSAVRAAFQEHRAQLRPIDNSEPASTSLAAEALHSLPHPELEGFLKQNPGLFLPEQLPLVKTEYCLNRMLRLGPEVSSQESLKTVLSESLAQVSPQQVKARSCFRSELLESFSQPQRSSLSFELVQLPGMLEYLDRRYGFEFQGQPPSNLKQLCQAHPEARLALQEIRPQFSGPQAKAFPLLQQMDVYRIGANAEPIEPKNFQEAYSLGSRRHEQLKLLPGDTLELLTPLSTCAEEVDLTGHLSPYQLLKTRPAELTHFLKNLDLQSEFSQVYGSPEKFWSSGDSLVEAVERMKHSRTEPSVSQQYLIR